MPSRGNLTWHPPFFGVKFRHIIHVYNFLLSYFLSYGILEYRRNLYSFTAGISFSITVNVDIEVGCLRFFGYR